MWGKLSPTLAANAEKVIGSAIDYFQTDAGIDEYEKELADGTGVSEIAIYTWESKMRQPTLSNFNKVLNKMGFELHIRPIETVPFYGDNKHLME